MPCNVQMLTAAAEDPDALGRMLEAKVADRLIDDEWRGAFRYSKEELEKHPDLYGWWTCVFLLEQPRTVAGMGGFKGRPREDGSVEIGYSIAPTLRGTGLATEAAQELLRIAWSHPEVTSVFAHTLAERNASTRVLEKCGFTMVGEMIVPEEGVFPVWRWRMTRP
jgi:RimJ/RimL family protein N-acetyltransferase